MAWSRIGFQKRPDWTRSGALFNYHIMATARMVQYGNPLQYWRGGKRSDHNKVRNEGNVRNILSPGYWLTILSLMVLLFRKSVPQLHQLDTKNFSMWFHRSPCSHWQPYFLMIPLVKELPNTAMNCFVTKYLLRDNWNTLHYPSVELSSWVIELHWRLPHT